MQRKEEETAERAEAQQRQKAHDRLVDQMRRYVPSPSSTSSGLESPTRSDRAHAQQLAEQSRREREADRWQRVQREWRRERADQQEKREAKEQAERERADAEAVEKHQRAVEARRARDDRIIQYMLSMQDQARARSAQEEARVQKAHAQEHRRQKAHLQARDAQAEEARRKQAEKRQERQEETERLAREQREKTAQLKSIASKGYRAAVSANSPKRRRSPGRSPQEDEAAPVDASIVAVEAMTAV